MEKLIFEGEHAWPGILGNAFVVIAFVAAILAAFSFYKATQNNNDSSWLSLGRTAFRVHTFTVWGICLAILYMLFNHYFEYHYIYWHSNSAMEKRYIFAAFWEGQEGSNLLWSFWHTVIGNLLIRWAKQWEAPVMAVVSSVQVFLMSLTLGVYVLDYRLGSNPFTVMLRDHPDFMQAPIFKDIHYLSKIDGRGLNPLLQNYWMTIHPPTLFLGFALTVVPFAYAIAGLWKRQYTEWFKPALPWTFFGIAVLGVGILMGGAWAYESLSFGGFWAWDPVENSSLVPWLTLVGAGHLMLIFRNKGTSLSWLYVLTFLSFSLILYSTFLTKSGVLGETSVHAFTDLGMSGQLLVYLLFYILLAFGLLIYHLPYLPKSKAEDEFWSREFWMFLGSLVLLISAFQISITTSIPVFNQVFGPDGLLPIMGKKIAPPVDLKGFYNSWQIPLSIIVALIIGVGQFLKYKKSDVKEVFKKLSLAIGLSAVLSAAITIALSLYNPLFIALLFTSLFAAVANADYYIRILKGKVTNAGASIAHVGFALILVGALISTGKSDIISQNSTGIDISQLGAEYKNNENILLFLNDTVKMRDFNVVYRGKKQEGVNIYYNVDFFKIGDDSKEPDFTLQPIIQTNPRMGNVAEPATKHYLLQDVYTHVTYAELENRETQSTDQEGYREPEMKELSVGDTIFATNGIVVLNRLVKDINKADFNLKSNDIVVGAEFSVYDFNTKKHTMMPLFIIRDSSYTFPFPGINEDLGLKLSFENVNPETGKISVGLFEKPAKKREFIILKAIVFPFINVLWLGCVLLALGTLLAIYHRTRKQQSKA